MHFESRKIPFGVNSKFFLKQASPFIFQLLPNFKNLPVSLAQESMSVNCTPTKSFEAWIILNGLVTTQNLQQWTSLHRQVRNWTRPAHFKFKCVTIRPVSLIVTSVWSVPQAIFWMFYQRRAVEDWMFWGSKIFILSKCIQICPNFASIFHLNFAQIQPNLSKSNQYCKKILLRVASPSSYGNGTVSAEYYILYAEHILLA